MTLEDRVYAFRLHALRRAEELGNVTAACRELGISRTVFYRWKKRFSMYGADMDCIRAEDLLDWGDHPSSGLPRRG